MVVTDFLLGLILLILFYDLLELGRCEVCVDAHRRRLLASLGRFATLKDSAYVGIVVRQHRKALGQGFT
ncbi:hypothetical protein D2V84_32135 [Burkholderia pseudomallei]|nr:hypothetical protein D2W72_34645 [Burkholderia pseudomallei]RIV62627.1 hypothetical protein D2V84_32135 [Burkholderia pseudomallei]